MLSSVPFTHVQGLDIMNPAAAEAKVNAANQKDFSANSGSLSIELKSRHLIVTRRLTPYPLFPGVNKKPFTC